MVFLKIGASREDQLNGGSARGKSCFSAVRQVWTWALMVPVHGTEMRKQQPQWKIFLTLSMTMSDKKMGYLNEKLEPCNIDVCIRPENPMQMKDVENVICIKFHVPGPALF